MYKVEIKHPNPAIGAKNKKFETNDKAESLIQLTKWVEWLDARVVFATPTQSKFKDEDGYEITWMESSTNIDDADYDTRN